MKKNNWVLVLLVIFSSISSLLILNELYQPGPNIDLEEFQERFDNESIVIHFKSTYPEHHVGWGTSPGVITPSWAYISANSQIDAELRTEEFFGNYKFTYSCIEVSKSHQFVEIENPTPKDIDSNLCW